MQGLNGFKERFNSNEDAPEWNQPAFDGGYAARLANQPITACPIRTESYDFRAQSWKAGWADADASMANEGEN